MGRGDTFRCGSALMIFDSIFSGVIRSPWRRALLAAVALTGVALIPSVAQAQNYVWGGTGRTTTTSDYNLGTNWSNPPANPPPVASGQSAEFSNAGSSTVTVTAGPITPDSWTFDANSQSYTVSGQAVNFGNAATLTNNANAGQSISIINNMTGTNLTQAGTSTLTLSGSNSFTNVNITAGTLALNGTGSVGASSVVTLGGTGVLDISQTTSGASIGSLADDGVGTAAVKLGSQSLTITNAGSGNSGRFSGAITGGGIGGGSGGGLTLSGGEQFLSGTNTYTGVTTVSFSALALSGSGSIANSSLVTVENLGEFDISFLTSGASIKSLGGDNTSQVTLGGNTLTITQGNSTFYGQIRDGGLSECICVGSIAITGGTETFAGANRYSGGTTISGGTLIISGVGTLGANTGSTTITGGTLDLGGTTGVQQASLTQSGGTVQNGTLTLSSNYTMSGGTLASNATIVAALFEMSAGNVAGVLSGSGELDKTGSGTLTLLGANTYSGNTVVTGGTVAIGNSSAFGTGNVTFGDGTTLAFVANGLTLTNLFSLVGADPTIDTGTNTITMGGVISGAGALTKLGSGTLILSANNTYTGATTVAVGTLDVTGSIAASGLTTVNSAAILTGTGTVGNASILTGGTLAPGNGTPGSSITVAGNLAFQSAALFLVQVNPATASFANVTGTAALGGATVSAVFANGSYIAKRYTILIGTGGVSGTFGSLVNSNLPSGFSDSLSYDATHAYLNLTLGFGVPPGLNGNQQNVGNALTNFFNSNGGIATVFGMLTPAGLTQASGEIATATQHATFDAMNLFTGLLTDPFIGERCEGVARGVRAAAEAQDPWADECRFKRQPGPDAQASLVYKAPPAAIFDRRWSVWAAGYGGSETTSGNAALGSNTATSRVYGTVVGADYRLSPSTLAGFALAGGGTNFGIANALGTGRSDLFQAGAFIRHTAGQAYVTGALAYGWQDVTTNRSVTIAGIDQLQAEFNSNAVSGRVEGGYRFATPSIAAVPYAAGQFTTYNIPAYAEQVLSGANTFALNYAARDVTALRSELGLRADNSYGLADTILTLRGRFAWAHNFNPDASVAATFQTLPGASFVVNGAAQAHEAALTTASAELKWRNGWSLVATFEGEFSNTTAGYAGKGSVRYQW